MFWEIFATSLDRFNDLVVGYYILINVLNTALLFLSLWIGAQYIRKRREGIHHWPLPTRSVPPISLLRVAFNESSSIVESVRSLLGLDYPDCEVVVIHDGSRDGTLNRLVEAFGLKPLDRIYQQKISTSGPIRGFYESPQFPRLIVVDKEHSGTADSLNVGINVSQNPYFCPVEADTVLERDGLLRLARPILEDPDRTVACSGIVRMVNDNTVRSGEVTEARLPGDALSMFQVVEQIRCVLFSQIGWARLHCLWGSFRALSLYQKKVVLKLGGYHCRSIRPEMDLMTRLNGRVLERRHHSKFKMILDQVAWTRAPQSLGRLARQRRSLHQGLIQSLGVHLRSLLRSGHGAIKILPLAVYAALKLVGPVIETAGYLTIALAWAMGMIDPQLLALFLFLVFFYGVFLSQGAVLLEAMTYGRYPAWPDLFRLLFYATIENFGYRQMNGWWRLQAIARLLIGRKEYYEYDQMEEKTSPSKNPKGYRKYYLTVRQKFSLAFLVAIGWLCLSSYLAFPWINDLAIYIPQTVAILLVAIIALLPGFLNAFLVTSLLFDRRPLYVHTQNHPPVSVLIAAFNEAKCIRQTVESVIAQNYPGELEIIVIDDGSTDETVSILKSLPYTQLKVIEINHRGKASALNYGLKSSKHDLIITIDADTYLYPQALQCIVARLCNDPKDTVAVAGAVLVRNSRTNWVTRVQEWDYFHGIASVKRLQSLYHGTLVAQGAFSVYRKSAVLEVGGWPETIGEDIVQTWAMLNKGYRIGFAEDAVVFTNVPDTYKGFFRQRRRWARGLIEAFKHHPAVLFKPRLTTLFIYWNLFFPIMDLVFLFLFIPGIVAAPFGHYFIAGPMTLAVLPLTLSINAVIYRIQGRMLRKRHLKVRRNIGGFIWFILTYQIIMAPASVVGYLAELSGLRKRWGTK